MRHRKRNHHWITIEALKNPNHPLWGTVPLATWTRVGMRALQEGKKR